MLEDSLSFAKRLKQRIDEIELATLRDLVKTFDPARLLSAEGKKVQEMLYQVLLALTTEKEVVASLQVQTQFISDLKRMLIDLFESMALSNMREHSSKENDPIPRMADIMSACKPVLSNCSHALKGDVQKAFDAFYHRGHNMIQTHYEKYKELRQNTSVFLKERENLRALAKSLKDEMGLYARVMLARKMNDTRERLVSLEISAAKIQMELSSLKGNICMRNGFLNELYKALREFKEKTLLMSCLWGCRKLDTSLGRIDNSLIEAVFALEEESPFKELVFKSIDSFQGKLKDQFCVELHKYCVSKHHYKRSEVAAAKGPEWEIIVACHFHERGMLKSWGKLLWYPSGKGVFSKETDIILTNGFILECKNQNSLNGRDVLEQLEGQQKVVRDKNATKGEKDICYTVFLLSRDPVKGGFQALQQAGIEVIDPTNPGICRELFEGLSPRV